MKPTVFLIFLCLTSCAFAQYKDVTILAINDFHGQISEGQKIGSRPVGGAAVLAAYLKRELAGNDDHTFIAEIGDLVGASEPASALLQDEPAIMVMNYLGNGSCSEKNRFDPANNLVGCLGNHEFDRGVSELLRLINGGNFAKGTFLENPWNGANFPIICANVIHAETGLPVVNPFVVKTLKNSSVRVAFIGAVLEETPGIVSAGCVLGLLFVNEARAINHQVKMLRENLGIHAFIVLIHQGERGTWYSGPTDSSKGLADGSLKTIISQLDDDVDVVCSAHSHSFTNALVPNKNGKNILVTQAFTKGSAFAKINLKIDTLSKDIVSKTAQIITTYSDSGVGLFPDKTIAKIVIAAKALVAPLTNRIMGKSISAITAKQNKAGESALGNLIADAQRQAMSTDFALMNPGGIRAIIASGTVTWGELFAVQPFSNSCIAMELTGKQIYEALNGQFADSSNEIMLQISGLNYTWDKNRPRTDRVIDIRKNGISIDNNARYSVTVNSFLATGGDHFSVFKNGTNKKNGPDALEVLVMYLSKLPQPMNAKIEGRILRLN